jgi:hypothetical protein
MEQIISTEQAVLTPGVVIKGTHYEFKKEGTYNCFIDYLKQDLVWEEWVYFVKSFANWLQENKPEVFTATRPVTLGVSFVSPIPSSANPRTQKAKGIEYIAKHNAGFRTIPFEILTGEDRDEEALNRFIANYSQVFARPCPEVPRHGFVDSRIVEGKDAILGLFKEVREVDPNGELVIMKPIQAATNCVITPFSVTIGAGHDGATAGKNTKTFPLFNLWVKKFKDLPASGIVETDVPYLETVYETGTPYLAQLRGGPAIETRSVDYVPEQVVVKEVIKAEGDLLQWESTMKSLSGREGVVVDHSGGALTSHYGVHAILNKVPVLTSRIPVVGETLEKMDDTAKPDFMAVIAGIVDSLQVPYHEDVAAKRVTAMIYSTQYFSGMQGKEAYYVGYGIGTMLSYGMAACGGEYRHNPNNPKKKHYARNTVYKRATQNFLKYRVTLAKWARSFALDPWSGSYGGLKWYDCADAVIQLDTETRKFLRTPSDETFKSTMMAMNRAINCAHNGGWWFNKFVQDSVFNQINAEHLPTIVKAVGYLYEQQPSVFGVEHLDFYNKYAGAKLINTKLSKSHKLRPAFAQVRIVASDSIGPNEITAENCGNKIRVQIEWWDGQRDEVTEICDNLKNLWDFNNKEFLKSHHSELVAYLPLAWEERDNNWVFALLSNGSKLYSVPVKYGFTKFTKEAYEQEEEE